MPSTVGCHSTNRKWNHITIRSATSCGGVVRFVSSWKATWKLFLPLAWTSQNWTLIQLTRPFCSQTGSHQSCSQSYLVYQSGFASSFGLRLSIGTTKTSKASTVQSLRGQEPSTNRVKKAKHGLPSCFRFLRLQDVSVLWYLSFSGPILLGCSSQSPSPSSRSCGITSSISTLWRTYSPTE